MIMNYLLDKLDKNIQETTLQVLAEALTLAHVPPRYFFHKHVRVRNTLTILERESTMDQV